MGTPHIINTIVMAADYFTRLERLDLLDDDLVAALRT